MAGSSCRRGIFTSLKLASNQGAYRELKKLKPIRASVRGWNMKGRGNINDIRKYLVNFNRLGPYIFGTYFLFGVPFMRFLIMNVLIVMCDR